jgi:diguanylate cyclase (GGDEF)-like protein
VQPTITLLSILGETIQTLGVLAITLLFLMLYRVLPRAYFLRWGQAWLAMLVALVSLYLVFSFPLFGFLEPLYFAGEYMFAGLLWLGFTAFPKREFAISHHFRWAIPALILWSIFLTSFNPYFANRFTLHAYVFIASLLPALFALWKLELPTNYIWVKRSAILALSLLMLNFFISASSLFLSHWAGPLMADCYFAYQSIFDFMFEVLLAFSMLTIAAVNMKGDLERANRTLQNERDSLSMLAHQDALTGCFNRHALSELQTRLRNRQGVVVMIDINDLKLINDHFGHHIGDQTICRVAQAIKAHMRGQDYLFRYGGDEFIVVSFDMQESEIEQRLQDIQENLKTGDSQQRVTISWGIQLFTDTQSFDKAIHAADGLMYQQKLAFHHASSV